MREGTEQMASHATPGGQEASIMGEFVPVTQAPRALCDRARPLGAAALLTAPGMPEAGIDRAADLAVETAACPPCPVTRAGGGALTARAGRPPEPALP
jgi:hypothetical protein